MKRLLSLMLAVIMVLSLGLVGCKEKDEEKVEEKKEVERCSQCNAKIVDGTLYCVGCGEKLEKEDKK
jgi:hypothetical protein